MATILQMTFPDAFSSMKLSLQWGHNACNGISNHWHLDCLFNCLFRCRSKKTSKLCITGLCEGYPPVTGVFPSKRASNMDVVFWFKFHWNLFQMVQVLWGLLYKNMKDQGSVSRCRLTSIGIPMLKIRQSHDRLIFNMGIPIPGKDGLYIDTGPWRQVKECMVFWWIISFMLSEPAS